MDKLREALERLYAAERCLGPSQRPINDVCAASTLLEQALRELERQDENPQRRPMSGSMNPKIARQINEHVSIPVHDGKMVLVHVQVDVDALARFLGYRAIYNATRCSTAFHGIIKVRALSPKPS